MTMEELVTLYAPLANRGELNPINILRLPMRRWVACACYIYWSSNMQKLFRDAGLPRRTAPTFMPHCREVEGTGSPPKITSPLRGVTYALREFQHTNDPNAAADESVNLRATTDADTREVFWFADQTFIGRANAGAGFAWRPSAAGNYTLRAVDDHGRADSRELRVMVVQ